MSTSGSAFLEARWATCATSASGLGRPLVVDVCRDVDAGSIVKGLRGGTDFAYELPMAHMNRHLTGVETLFLAGAPELQHVSSSLVKEVVRYGGDVRGSSPTPCSSPCERPTPLIWAAAPPPVALDVGPRPPWRGPNHSTVRRSHDRPDPRSPLVLDTRELDRRPGTMLELSRTVDLPEDLGTDVIAIQAGTPVDIEVRLESVVEGVLLTGSVRGTASGACVRCLDPVELAVDGTFKELFAYTDRAAHHHEVGPTRTRTRCTSWSVDLIDLEPVLRDAVVPTLPFQPVCRPDCPGLCSECGVQLADDPDHHHDVFDPRWSALRGLLRGRPQEKRN